MKVVYLYLYIKYFIIYILNLVTYILYLYIYRLGMPCTKLKHCQTLQVTKLQITIIDNYKFRNFPAFDNENRRK